MTGDRETCDGKAQTTSLQLTLWETPDDGQGRTRDTNAVGIYDQAPRFVFFGTNWCNQKHALTLGQRCPFLHKNGRAG